jgi:hypothetical protein
VDQRRRAAGQQASSFEVSRHSNRVELVQAEWDGVRVELITRVPTIVILNWGVYSKKS